MKPKQKAESLKQGQHVWVAGNLMSFEGFEQGSPVFRHVAKHMRHINYHDRTKNEKSEYEPA